MPPSSKTVTQMLVEWSEGHEEVWEELAPLVYDELRRLAHRQLRREGVGHTLQATALVHEAYLRLIEQRHVRWQNRAHFFGVASQMMRRILVNYARDRRALKRGGSAPKLPLNEALAWAPAREVELVALDEALTRLAAIDPQKSRIIELRFFAGATNEETAEVLGVSPATVKNKWNLARAWLYRELTSQNS